MTSRSIWKLRGSSAFRAPTRIVECPHCGAKYDVARDFDLHYQGACVRQEERSAESSEDRANG